MVQKNKYENRPENIQAIKEMACPLTNEESKKKKKIKKLPVCCHISLFCGWFRFFVLLFCLVCGNRGLCLSWCGGTVAVGSAVGGSTVGLAVALAV
jgi:hypothetical protein